MKIIIITNSISFILQELCNWQPVNSTLIEIKYRVLLFVIHWMKRTTIISLYLHETCTMYVDNNHWIVIFFCNCLHVLCDKSAILPLVGTFDRVMRMMSIWMSTCPPNLANQDDRLWFSIFMHKFIVFWNAIRMGCGHSAKYFTGGIFAYDVRYD